MRHTVLFLLLVLTSVFSIAQDELNRLADIVLSLPKGGEKAFNTAVATLGTDALWTPMNELKRDNAAECTASDRVPGFRLNSILNKAENSKRLQATTSLFLNGADCRYNYSLFERTIRAGRSVKYTLPERWGNQVILIIPYAGRKAGIKASAKSGKNQFKTENFGDGGWRISGNASKSSPLVLTISSSGNDNQSYVIINYNSRK